MKAIYGGGLSVGVLCTGRSLFVGWHCVDYFYWKQTLVLFWSVQNLSINVTWSARRLLIG